MEILTVLILLLIVYLVVSSKADITRKLNQLEQQISNLTQLTHQFKTGQHIPSSQSEVPPATEVASPSPAAPVDTPQAPPTPQPKSIIPDPTVTDSEPQIWETFEPTPTITPESIERQPEVIGDSLSVIKRPVKTGATPPPFIAKPPVPPREPKPTFFERNPDLEKFIGENLINKIGIAILVLAIGFFVKYAIDNNWIGPVGRVGVGIACGGILIAIAHRLRNSYKAFSSVLVGGGLAIFYFTITLAFHQFKLFDQTAAFIILMVITIFAVLLSLLYDKQELAIIALVGGFASPFMVSSGHANYSALFIYLLILNAGLLIIAYFKAWRLLNIISFAFTVIAFASILYTLTPTSYHTGFIYASIFYVLYFVINVAHNVKENKKFIASDFTILLSNTALYFAAGLYLLTEMHLEQFRGLFCVSLGVVNLVLSYILFRNRKVDTNILYLLIGITLTFISLAAPIQLHGHTITIFWAFEAVLLYWLYQRSAIQLMKFTSVILWLAMLVSLFIDWYQMYGISSAYPLTIIANKGFITTFIAAVSSYLLSVLVSKDDNLQLRGIKVDKHVFSVAALVLLYLSGVFELNHQFMSRYSSSALTILYIMLYTPVFIYGYYLLSIRVKSLQFNANLRLALLLACIVAYLALTPAFFDAQSSMITSHIPPPGHFTAHWLSAIFISLLFYRVIRLCQTTLNSSMKALFIWLISGGIVVFLSLEVSLLSNMLFADKTHTVDQIETVYIKTGLPILWGLLSFALMWLGMRHKVKTMRIASLSLFSLTLLKLFLFDIRNIPVAGKIAAFFCLGVLLLIISFMYQRVKKLIVDDEIKPKTDEKEADHE